MRIDGRNKKDTYMFNDVRERENFCQLVQQLKNMHSIHQEVDNISLFVGTWNMGKCFFYYFIFMHWLFAGWVKIIFGNLLLTSYYIWIGDESPPWNLGQWLKSQGVGKTREKTLCLIPHDMYVIGTQESGLSDKDWTNRLKEALYGAFSQEYHTVSASYNCELTYI